MLLRRISLLMLLVSACLALQAATPEDQYLRVYNLIEEAESLQVAGQGRAAVQKYRDALDALVTLQANNPGWSSAMVTFRLEFLRSQVQKLAAKFPATAPGGTNAVPANQPPKVLTGPPAEVIKVLQEDNARLANDIATLQAKLREALSVQPAGSDPRELAKAQEQINSLLKERDLLKVSLDQAKAARPTPAAGDVERLTQQAAVVSLQRENETLKLQVSELQAKVAAGRKGDNGKDLEKQLAKAHNAIRELEDERDALNRKLNDAQKELKGKLPTDTAAKLDDLTRQLTVARARLEAYEARPVPFTAEENALFRHTPAKFTVTTETNVVKRKPPELPRGAAPLFNEAQRAIDAKRFDDAEEKLKQVLRQDENNVFVLANLAAVQIDIATSRPNDTNKPAEAEQHLKKALTIDPRDATSLYLMGSLKYGQEKYDEALDALSQSASINADNAMTQYFLARVLIYKGNAKAAETAFRKAIMIRPNFGEAHYQLAVIYATQNPPFRELAQWHYQKAIACGVARNFDFERRLEPPGAGAKP